MGKVKSGGGAGRADLAGRKSFCRSAMRESRLLWAAAAVTAAAATMDGDELTIAAADDEINDGEDTDEAPTPTELPGKIGDGAMMRDSPLALGDFSGLFGEGGGETVRSLLKACETTARAL